MTNTYINYDKLFNPFLIKPNLKKQNTRFFRIGIFIAPEVWELEIWTKNHKAQWIVVVNVRLETTLMLVTVTNINVVWSTMHHMNASSIPAAEKEKLKGCCGEMEHRE